MAYRTIGVVGGVLFSFLGMVLSASPVHAAECTQDNLRWASSSNTLYLSGPVTCTLTAIKTHLPNAPITLMDPAARVWMLGTNLHLQNGATLTLHGSELGGDVDELRLKSNNSSDANSIVWIRAHWGTLDIRSTTVTSWDESANEPDTDYGSNKRAFIHVRSLLEADGTTARESRMDIIDSDVGYLGYYAAESYGLVWKVSGSGAGLYDKVGVHGTIENSHIHHNYFGMYTYGAEAMTWRNNEIDHNVQYGLDPHDDSDRLVIENNYVHDNGNHGIICSQRCDHLTIRGNRSNENAGNGIMLHRNTNDSLVEGNETIDNTDSGIAIFDSHNNTLRDNTIRMNNRGIRLSVGASGNAILDNRIEGNETYGLYFYQGSDAPTSGDGRPKNNRFEGNLIAGNDTGAIRLADSDRNLFKENIFAGNGSAFTIERGVDNRLVANTLDNTSVSIKGNSSIAGVARFESQPRVRILLDSYSRAIFEDTTGHAFDPEESTLATTITPTGSSLTLTKAQTDGSSTVLRRLLRAVPNSGTILVNPTLWETSGGYRKNWSLRPATSSQTTVFTVGDLKPGISYRIRKNGVMIMTKVANSDGQIQFSNVSGTTATILYAVEVAPASP